MKGNYGQQAKQLKLSCFFRAPAVWKKIGYDKLNKKLEVDLNRFDSVRINMLSIMAWDVLKEQLGYDSWAKMPPYVLYNWAIDNNVANYLPAIYKDHSMITANQVADYIVLSYNPQKGDLISHIYLHVILYYCQGIHLAMHEEPLFIEPIEHWSHSPVVPVIYKLYKHHGLDALPWPPEMDMDIIKGDSKEVMDEVLIVYGQFSASKLLSMVKKELPWMLTPDCEIISHEKLKSYFQSQIE